MANPSGGITTQGSEPRLLQEGINAVTGLEYKDYVPEYTKIFTVYDSEKAYELDASLSGMGLAPKKPEGTATSYDSEQQDFITTYVHSVYSLGTIITMEAQMNNLYRDLVFKSGKMLKRSLVHTDEQLAADVINNAYTATIGDGQALFSASHVLGKGGTFSNMFSVHTPLSDTAIQNALIAIEDFRDGAGLLIDARGVSLHIPRQLRFTADKFLASRFEPSTANNAINPVADIFPGGYHVNHRFTSSTDWFIKTDVDDGFKIFNRADYTFETDNDFGTSNYRHKGWFYKSYGLTDPRAAYGSNT